MRPAGTGPLRIGAQLPTREAVLFHDGAPRHVVAAAERAEQLGFDSVWAGDSLTARPRLEPLAMLAAVAARTERVALGTAVLLPALRHPLLAAHQIATVDRIAQGRLIVGVGAGAGLDATRQEFAAVGVPFDERVARLYESVRLWRRVWSGGAESWAGRFWSLDDVVLAPPPAASGGPPVWLAGEGPQTLRHAGRSFDGWLPFSPDAQTFAAGLAAVRAEEERSRRLPGAVVPAAYLTVTIDDDPRAAESAQAEHMEAYYDAPYDFMRAFQGCCAGAQETVASWLQTYVDAGARHLVLRVGTARRVDEQLERLSAVAADLRAEAATGG